MGDEKILSFNDVVLRRSDLDILSGPNFLNDRIIEFYLSYLSTLHPSHKILLIPPSITFWISNCPDVESLEDFLKPLNLRNKNLVIFPVNDNNDVEIAEGGTHWSLLVYYRDAHAFVHHDSNGGANRSHAKRLYKTVAEFAGDADAIYRECTETPQQRNGYDCGIYVLALARVICQWFNARRAKKGEELWFSDTKKMVPDSVTRLREELLELIRGLMAERN